MPPKRTVKSDAAVVAKTHAALDEIADVAAHQTSSSPSSPSSAKDKTKSPKAAAAKSPKSARASQKQQQQQQQQQAQASKLHPAARFPLAATISFALASLGYSLLGEVSKGDLAAVSRSQDTWGEVALLAAWRTVELALGWFANLDSLDVAMMDLLAHGPSLYLLTAFYSLHPLTALSALVIDVISAAVPFYLLRPLSAAHSRTGKLPNAELIDLPMQAYTAALATGIYSVTIVLSLRFLLPQILVVHFRGLPTLEPAYGASYGNVLPATFLFGIAASIFIYAPFVLTGKAKEDDKIGAFDPAKATLGQTVQWNVWGYTARTKVVVSRTAFIMFVTGVNTYLACTMTIYGIGAIGALAYAGVWVFAALSTGLALKVVGSD